MKKWKYKPISAIEWWKALSIDEKADYKARFEVYRNKEDVINLNYPNMFDLTNIRISQFSDKHIVRIWIFKDRI